MVDLKDKGGEAIRKFQLGLLRVTHPLREYVNYGWYLTRNYYPTFTYLQTTGDAYIPWRVRNAKYVAGGIVIAFGLFELWNMKRIKEAHFRNVAARKA